MENVNEVEPLRLLYDRLERISADSYLAHRASGIRGSMSRILEKYDRGETVDFPLLENLYNLGYYLLVQAASERNRRSI